MFMRVASGMARYGLPGLVLGIAVCWGRGSGVRRRLPRPTGGRKRGGGGRQEHGPLTEPGLKQQRSAQHGEKQTALSR